VKFSTSSILKKIKSIKKFKKIIKKIINNKKAL